jgi:hypothetical protein
MTSVENTFQTKYKNNLEMELQLYSNPLEDAVTVQEDASAELIKIKDIAGNKQAQEDNERGGDTKWNETPYDGVFLAKPNELYDAEIVENSDKLSTAIDLEGTAVKGGAAVVTRARVQRILEGFFSPIQSGRKGTVLTPFPNANFIDVNAGAAGPSRMNTEKLIKAGEFLDASYVDQSLPRFMVLDTQDNSALLREVPATSSDFKGAYGGEFNNGRITRMLGWTFIHLQLENPLLKVKDLYTDANGYRLNPFWVKPGVVLNYWQRLRTEVGKIPEKRFMPGYLAGTTCAATRTQAGMSGAIRNQKG